MIEWNAEYEIGIPVIDAQHRRIVDYINEVEALDSTIDKEEKLSEILTLLVDYTLSHFEFEEALMEEAEFPELVEHQLTHSAFKNQIELLRQRLTNGEDIANVLYDVLKQWLIGHIREDDSSYANCVKDKILKHKLPAHQRWVKQATDRFFKN